MNESLHLGRIGGVRIGLNWSLVPLFLLMAWSLASYQLPGEVPGYTGGAYWVAGLITTVALFASLLAHELSHAALARRHGMAVKGIVLWLFGGMAQTEGDMTDARTELQVALVGPGTSLAIAAVAAGAAWGLDRVGVSPLIVAAVAWLAAMNALLGVFNLLPAFPLDGGRVLRALLWRRWGDKLRATSAAALAGRGIGYGLVALGALEFIARADLGGMWLALIGWFIASAAGQQERQAVLDTRIGPLHVAAVMTPNPVVVPAESTVGDVIERFVRTNRFSSFPVGDRNGRIVGLTTIPRLAAVPLDRRPYTPITAVAAPPAEIVVCAPDDPIAEVAARMERSHDRRALVIDEGRLVGIVAPSDLAHAADHAGLVGPPEPVGTTGA